MVKVELDFRNKINANVASGFSLAKVAYLILLFFLVIIHHMTSCLHLSFPLIPSRFLFSK